jgi:hypothetical protein|tara:strand:- start:529 stop:723 length:195 start_codon:yes stop_codon:yes gene_type:complete
MPDIKTFYPGGSSTNPVNNSTASVTATNVDDQNSANNALVWTGTAAQYAALGSKDANTLYFVTA